MRTKFGEWNVPDLIFNNAVKSPNEVGELIKTMMTMWMRTKFDLNVYTMEDFKAFLGRIR